MSLSSIITSLHYILLFASDKLLSVCMHTQMFIEVEKGEKIEVVCLMYLYHSNAFKILPTLGKLMNSLNIFFPLYNSSEHSTLNRD